MTEDESKEKWCPFKNAYYVDRDDDYTPFNNDNCKCMASECMMWRWEHMSVGEADYNTPEGYCGLAGKP